MTKRRPMTPAERQQRSRERKAAARIHYTTPQWRQFLDPDALPRLASCDAANLPAMALREISDNGADEGGATIEHDAGWWIVRDVGPGIAPDDVPMIFNLRRDSLSSKLVRRPQRGQLGHGLRVACGFAAIHGLRVAVASRGVRQTLAFDRHTGATTIAEREAVEDAPGCAVAIEARGPLADDRAGWLARLSLAVREGDDARTYTGPSLPGWYGVPAFAAMLTGAPEGSTVADVIRSMGLPVPAALPRDLAAKASGEATAEDAAAFLAALAERHPPIPAERLGRLGRDAFADNLPTSAGYARAAAEWRDEGGARLPVVVECWATCERKRERGGPVVRRFHLYANRSASLTALSAVAAQPLPDKPHALVLTGAGCSGARIEAKPADHATVVLSIVTPFLPSLDAGKALDLGRMRGAVTEALSKALAAARRKAPADEAEAGRLTAEREAEEARRAEGKAADEAERRRKAEEAARKRQEAEAEARRLAERRTAEEAARARWQAEAEANPLHRLAVETAAALGLPLRALAVLREQADPFTLDGPAMRQAAEWAAEQAARYMTAKHLRAWHYAIASTGGTKPGGANYLNNAADFRWSTERAAKAARWLGLIPWDRFGDARNDPPTIFATTTAIRPAPFAAMGVGGADPPPLAFDPSAMLPDLSIPPASAMLPRPALAGQAAQKWRVVLWTEKASAAAMVERIAAAVGGEAIVGTGEASDSLLHGVMQRAAADGRGLAVVVLSDLDPSGVQMGVSIGRKVQAWRVQNPALANLPVKVARAGITVEQAERWGLLSTPLKETEKRRKAWIAQHGREQTELDAALIQAPGELEAALREVVGRFHDFGLSRRASKAAAEWRSAAEEWRDAAEWWPEHVRAIEEAHAEAEAKAEAFRERLLRIMRALRARADAVEAARDRLREAQGEAVGRLRAEVARAIEAGDLPPVPDLPEPDLAAGDAGLIFDSAEPFLAATVRLLAAKLGPDHARVRRLRGEAVEPGADDDEGDDDEAEGDE